MKGLQQLSLLFSAIVLTCVAGCAGGPPFHAAAPPPPDAARVYVYRIAHYNPMAGIIPNAVPYKITTTDGHSIDLTHDGYCTFLSKIGTNTVGSAMEYSPSIILAAILANKELLKTNFAGGETYYLKFEVGTFGSKMKVMDKAVGVEEIKRCKLISETD